MAQFVGVQFLVACTYAFAIGYVFADMDPTKYAFELIATPPIYRDSREIVCLLILRIAVHLFIYPETFRSGVYLLSYLLFIIDRARLVMITLCKTNSFEFYFRFYRQCLLIYKLMYGPIQFLVYVCLTVMFWLAVFLFWVSVRLSPKTISIVVYTWHVVSFFILVTAGFVFLSEFCNTMEMALQTVVIHRLRARLVFSKRRTKYSKLNYYHARSVNPLRISYGFFGWIGKDFVGEFSRVLTLRCFDVIMLF